ncbi:Uncharacterized protein Mb2253c, partial [Camellia lanceoleosa]
GRQRRTVKRGGGGATASVLADFVAEFTGELANLKPDEVRPKPDVRPKLNWRIYVGDIWQLYCDGSSNQRGSGAEVVIMSPDGAVIEQAVKLGFETSNNEAEYKALLADLRNAHLLGTRRLLVFCDSKLVISQLKGEYAARNDRMAAYIKMANSLLAKFDHHELNQITCDQNTHANALACLASAINFEIKQTIEVGFIPEPSIGPSEEIHVN